MPNPFLILVLAAAQVAPLQGQSRSERREQAVRASEKPQDLKGGTRFTVRTAYGPTYDLVLNALKHADYGIETAGQEVGQIVTSLVVEGGWRQKGRRVIVTILKEKDGATTVKCLGTVQGRFKAFQTEPWGEPELDEAGTAKVAGILADALKAKPVS